MTIDNEGRLYVATGAGVEVLSPKGQHLGTIPVRCPPADCQNVAFIGPEKRTLYIASAGFLYKVAMVARGFTGRAPSTDPGRGIGRPRAGGKKSVASRARVARCSSWSRG